MDKYTPNTKITENNTSYGIKTPYETESSQRLVKFVRQQIINSGLSYNKFAHEVDIHHLVMFLTYKTPATANIIFKLSKKLTVYSIVEFCDIISELKSNGEIR